MHFNKDFYFGAKSIAAIFAIQNEGGLAQLARAFAWHAKGHRFDSGNLHKQKNKDKSLLNLIAGGFLLSIPYSCHRQRILF